MRARRSRGAFLVAALGLCITLAVESDRAAAQETGTIMGLITDSTGNPVVGVAVRLVRPPDSVVASAITGKTGRYLLQGLAPGKGFRLVVTRLGFSDIADEEVSIFAGDTLTINFKLSSKPLVLDTLVIAKKKKLWLKYRDPVSRKEILGNEKVETAREVLSILRPQAVRIRSAPCSMKMADDRDKLKLYVDSTLIDRFGNERLHAGEAFRFRRLLRRLKVPQHMWVALGKIPATDIISVSFTDCGDYSLPRRFRNAIWITTKKAPWLTEEDGAW